jgi:hypothetical protein
VYLALPPPFAMIIIIAKGEVRKLFSTSLSISPHLYVGRVEENG